MNSRLSCYVEENILGQEQAGFREGYSTIDHVFVLHVVIELYKSVYKRIYCAFIDYRKAFDSIDRSILWQKLLSCGINEKMFIVIKDIYDKAKSCLMKDNMRSEYFMCSMGVRQGDNLSPLLFALFLNDFAQHMTKVYHGLNIADTCYPSLKNENLVFLKLFVLLYAEDIGILSENEHELQQALNGVYNYCIKNCLHVNTDKTKIVIFSRGKVKKYPVFNYGDSIIEVVNDYVYLGVTINYDNKFAKAIRKQLDQGRRAQFALLVKARKLDLPIDVQCILFDKTVIPVLLYGSEVWGFSSINMLESFNRKYLKKILKLRPSTPNCMIYGEVGKLPLQVTVDKNMINYWLRLLNKDQHTLAYIMYTIIFTLFTRNEYKAKWLCRIKCILDSCGLSYMWDNQTTIDTATCKKLYINKLKT